MDKKKFTLPGGHEYLAEDYIDGYLINPRLQLDCIPKIPFILRIGNEYSVLCLIEGSLRCSGIFDNLGDALSNHARSKNKKM